MTLYLYNKTVFRVYIFGRTLSIEGLMKKSEIDHSYQLDAFEVLILSIKYFPFIFPVNISTRFIIFVMLCLNAINISIIRGNISIVILAMAKPLYNTTAEVPDVIRSLQIITQ